MPQRVKLAAGPIALPSIVAPFEWDPDKAEANFAKHRVTFAEAATAFADPRFRLIPDPDHSVDEER
jgi:uncharacterized DUF497 family protein